MVVGLAAAMQVAAPPSVPDDDIVVMARQLSKVRFSYHTKSGRTLSCDIERSTDIAALDAMVCDAVRQCAAEHPTIGERGLVPCIKDRVNNLSAAYRARRATLLQKASNAPDQ